MTWSEKTFHDNYQKKSVKPPYARYYHYHFRERWTSKFTTYKACFELDVKTAELAVFGITEGHNYVLKHPDFSIRGMNVMDWARSQVKSGKADFQFRIFKPEHFVSDLQMILRARFSDKKTAVLFKMLFV